MKLNNKDLYYRYHTDSPNSKLVIYFIENGEVKFLNSRNEILCSYNSISAFNKRIKDGNVKRLTPLMAILHGIEL